MKMTVENTEAELAATIDEVSNAKAIISLDGHDFADVLQDDGELFIIKAEQAAGTSEQFAALCKAVGDKFKEIIEGKKLGALVLFISHSNDYPLMPIDMSNVVNIFHDIELDEVPVKWGVGENEDNNVKLTIVMKVWHRPTESGACQYGKAIV